jgi:hypothetical protein
VFTSKYIPSINQAYIAGIFSISVINLSLSKIVQSRSMCAIAWNGRRRIVTVRLFCCLCARAGKFFCVILPPPTAVRPAHRTENEECYVLKNVAVKKNHPCARFHYKKRFIPAVKKTAEVPTALAR